VTGKLVTNPAVVASDTSVFLAHRRRKGGLKWGNTFFYIIDTFLNISELLLV
jgi:hypothetical protein